MADEQSTDEARAADDVADAWAAVLIDIHEKQAGPRPAEESADDGTIEEDAEGN